MFEALVSNCSQGDAEDGDLVLVRTGPKQNPIAVLSNAVHDLIGLQGQLSRDLSEWIALEVGKQQVDSLFGMRWQDGPLRPRFSAQRYSESHPSVFHIIEFVEVVQTGPTGS